MTRVVVTGVGAVTPAGIGEEPLWDRLLEGRSCIGRIDRFDASRYDCQIAGQADDFVAGDWLPPRFTRKTDRFTHLAMVASELALKDAGLALDAGAVNPDRVGVMVGNVLGGWEFAERELRELWVEGPRQVSPYQATAWFPAAPQGNICIRYGIKGRSRTLVCDRASGLAAIAHAAETIGRDQADVMLAGGTEQPLSPYAWLCCQTSGYLVQGRNDSPESAYRPFDREHAGSVLGEGSAFLVLESLEHARARGATILGELTGWSLTSDGYMPAYTFRYDGAGLAAATRQTLDRAGVAASDVGAVVADAAAIPAQDASEVAGLRAALNGSAGAPVTSSKATIGHLMGAAGAVDSVVALRALDAGVLPPIANLEEPAAGFDLDFVRSEPRHAPELRNVLVVSRGLGGVNACLLVSHPS
jgi:3-oxoacyl-(acyl-carrier-protein) synthase